MREPRGRWSCCRFLIVVLGATACSATNDGARDTSLVPIATPAPATAPAPTTVATTTAVPATPVATEATTTTPPPNTEPTLPTITVEPTTPPVDPAALPAVDAAAYAVFDVASGRWLAETNADTQRPVASLMKLLTAPRGLQAGEPERIVTVPAMQFDPEESIVGLYEGERIRRDVLFRAMMIASANDAARALANDIGDGDESADSSNG